MTVRELIERLKLKDDTAEIELYDPGESKFVPMVGIVEAEDGSKVILCDKDTLDSFR